MCQRFMPRFPRLIAPAFCLLLLQVSTGLAFAQLNVLTYHNDNIRTGQNLAEKILTPRNVNQLSFGKLFNLRVDGKVDAEPLYVSNLAIGGRARHNVVFIATEHNSVYAFNADSGQQYWHVSLSINGETTSDIRKCGQVDPEIGITATPVIDLKAGPHGTIYLVAMTKDTTDKYYQRLHALDITTGQEEFGAPVEVQASYPGTGDNSDNGRVVFDGKQYKERAALSLLNGTVYTTWTSHCDIRPYTGWVMGYDRLTLKQRQVFNFAPNGNEASMWSGGAGPAADALGNLYFSVGNGTFDTTLNAHGFPEKGDFGNAFVKLSTINGKLAAADYWTMYNTVAESDRDGDLGSGGILLLPDLKDASGRVRHLATGAGKDMNVYIVDRDAMGKFNPEDNSNIYQELPGALKGGEFSIPAYFHGYVYYGGISDVIRAFKVDGAKLSKSPASVTAEKFPYPGATPTVSANDSSNGVVWAVENKNPAVLHAYDANDLAKELYNSGQGAKGRDTFGAGNKWMSPMVANGKVYVGTTNSVAVFGLLKR
jgi:hypothetical protein